MTRLQRFDRVEVEVVGGLIDHEDLGRGGERHGELSVMNKYESNW